MAIGPEIPDIKVPAPPVVQAPRRVPSEPNAPPRPDNDRQLLQAPDTVQLSPRAQEASRVRNVAEAAPEVRPERVQEASAQLRSQSSSGASLNAKLAEKLLTEN